MTTDEKKPQLHVTALNMFSKCGEQFRRRYLEGEILPPGMSLLVGTATDRSVSANLGHKIEKGELLTVDACEQAARDAFEVEWQKGGVKLSSEEREMGLTAVRGEKKEHLDSCALSAPPYSSPLTRAGWAFHKFA